MSGERLNILFVDDEQRILDGLRRQLHPRRQVWDMRFVTSGAEAIRQLNERPAEIIVSDMRMPGMTGGELFQKLIVSHPQTTRIILSGQTDLDDLLRDLGCIHQYLQKPCDPIQLCSAIERAFTLTRMVQQPQLRGAAGRITALPPGGMGYRHLVAELSRDDANLERVCDIVSADPALAVKIMQLVNSAFFGMPRHTSTPSDAVRLLGLPTLRSIVVAARLFEYINTDPGDVALHDAADELRPHIESLWQRCSDIGEMAARLAKQHGAPPADQNQARLAGLLSLVGRAILMTSMPADYRRVLDLASAGGRTLSQCETEIFGASQDDLAAYALGLWAFSDDVVTAVANQSQPTRVPNARSHHPVGFLHLARALCMTSLDGFDDRVQIDDAFSARPGVAALLAGQRKAAA